MIIDKTVKGVLGIQFNLPKLDRFVEGPHGWIIENGEVFCASESTANEEHIDKYLEEFCPLFVKLARFFGTKEAMNLLLAKRNVSKARDRIKAAQEIAAMIPDLAKLKNSLTKEGIYLDWDHYDIGHAWVWKYGEFTGLIVGVNDHRRLTVNEGDGYHRGEEETADPPFDFKEFCGLRLRETIVKELKFMKEMNDPDIGFDEKYERRYNEVHAKLNKKTYKKKARGS